MSDSGRPHVVDFVVDTPGTPETAGPSSSPASTKKVPPRSMTPYPRLYPTKPASTGSCTSIRTVGMYPLGSLRVHQASPSPSVSSPVSPPGSPSVAVPAASAASAESAASAVSAEAGASDENTPNAPYDAGVAASDVIVILGVPEGFTLGIDSLSFESKSRFKGFKHVPAGTHFVWATENPYGISSRSGVWICSHGVGEVFVVQWDSWNYVMGPPSLTETRLEKETRSRSASNHDLLSYKALFANVPASSLNDWAQISCFITPTLLARVTGKPDPPWTSSTADRARGEFSAAPELELEKQLESSFPAHDDKPAHKVSSLVAQDYKFSFPQTEQTYDTSVRGEERSAQAMDATSHIVQKMQQHNLSAEDVVGELQFAFICGAHLGNPVSLNQWKHMLAKLFLRAYGLPNTAPALAWMLTVTWAAQLRHADANLACLLEIGLDPQADSTFPKALAVYKRRIDAGHGASGSSDPRDATSALARVRFGTAWHTLEAAALDLGWDIRPADTLRKGLAMLEDGAYVELEADASREDDEDDEEGEYAPVMVDLDDHGRQLGSVSWHN